MADVVTIGPDGRSPAMQSDTRPFARPVRFYLRPQGGLQLGFAGDAGPTEGREDARAEWRQRQSLATAKGEEFREPEPRAEWLTFGDLDEAQAFANARELTIVDDGGDAGVGDVGP